MFERRSRPSPQRLLLVRQRPCSSPFPIPYIGSSTQPSLTPFTLQWPTRWPRRCGHTRASAREAWDRGFGRRRRPYRWPSVRDLYNTESVNTDPDDLRGVRAAITMVRRWVGGMVGAGERIDHIPIQRHGYIRLGDISSGEYLLFEKEEIAVIEHITVP